MGDFKVTVQLDGTLTCLRIKSSYDIDELTSNFVSYPHGVVEDADGRRWGFITDRIIYVIVEPWKETENGQ